MILGHFKLAL